MCSCDVRVVILLACVLVLAPLDQAAAQTQSSSDNWVLTAGGDVDDQDGYRLDLGVAWLPSPQTSFTLAGGRADSSADFNDLSSSSVSLGFDHTFGRVGITADARWWGDTGVVDSQTYGGSFYLLSARGQRGGWRVALRGELRQSDFEPFTFDAVVPIRTPTGLVLVPISGVADCDLDNTAVGLSAGHSGKAWGFWLGGAAYDYDETDCATRDIVIPPQAGDLPPIGREIFRRIAARVVSASARLIGTQLTRENGFLESTVQAGLSFTSGEWLWAADYFHDREEFAGLESDTLLGSVTLPLGDRSDLELRAGVTDGEFTGNVGFAGLTFFFYLSN
jgi:hypothetical protein